jgi:ribosomal peptide maturation radical SAM protein 1
MDVCLVLMPYADVPRPSLALGLLQASLRRADMGCTTLYANLTFAERLDWGVPDASHLERLLGEWTFAGAAFDPPWTEAVARDGDRREADRVDRDAAHLAREAEAARLPTELPDGIYRSTFLPPGAYQDPRFVESLRTLREGIAPRFVDEIAREVLARRPRIVGCSSTFEQHCASLALLRRIRDLAPDVVTLIGGANCEAEMGWATVRSFPWIDFAVSGEADEIIAPLCRSILERGRDLPTDELPSGVLSRAHVREGAFADRTKPVPRAVVRDVDALPTPDYADWFAALERSPLRRRIRPGLLVETSRGCWWGAKHHCTFCGLNGGGMAYRAKSPERALAEMSELARRHGVPRFMVVDNILDQKYLTTLLPELGRREAPFELFFETKANLRREQVETLARAGVTWIQPGIEAFDDEILKLMDKGSTALMNVQLLKYTRELGIHTTWLLLYGFPGEDDRRHAAVAEWLPALFHLQPPRCVGKVLFDRFSVYQQDPSQFGLRLEPDPSYERVYPLDDEALADLAYFFVDATEPKPQLAGPGARALIRRVLAWTRAFRRPVKPVLTCDDDGDAIEFFDTRPCAAERRHAVSGLEAAVYRACDPGADAKTISRRVAEATGAPPAEQDVAACLARLAERKLVLTLGDRWLSLALRGDVPPICGAEDFPGGQSEIPDPFAPEALDRLWERTRAWTRELAAREAARGGSDEAARAPRAGEKPSREEARARARVSGAGEAPHDACGGAPVGAARPEEDPRREEAAAFPLRTPGPGEAA